jgi:hypothetical protein
MMATAKTEKKVKATDPKWSRNRSGQFHRLSFIEPDKEGLQGIGGIFVVWHAGVKPRWIAVDKSRDLAASFAALARDEEIRQYQVHGGVFATWALIREKHQDRVLKFLISAMKPIIEPAHPPADAVRPVSVILPGA